MEGIVYVLTNKAMPNLVKIELTTKSEVESRMAELSRVTSVPLPFDCEYAARVSDCRRLEQALHHAFGPDRINPKREFFEIEPDRVIGLIKLLEIENVTPEVAEDLNQNQDDVDREAKKKFIKKRPRMNFVEMGIPIGSILHSTDGDQICEVVNERKIKFNGEEMSLTKASKMVTGKDYLTNPCPWWIYQGKSLSQLYNETHSFEE